MTNSDPRPEAPGHPLQHGGYDPRFTQPTYPTYPYGFSTAPPVAPRSNPARRAMVAVGAAAVAAALAISGFAIGRAADGQSLIDQQAVAGSGSVGSGSSGSGAGSTGGLGNSGGSGQSNGGGTGGGPGYIPTQPGIGSGSGSSTSGQTSASSTQQAGIVTIVSTLGYQSAQSAGTGMVLSSDGKILTNNHVINGATSIKVTVESTDRTYRADVVGTDPSDDVAVLKLRNASGLTTAKVGDDSDVSALQVGDTVTGVGNSNGGGTLLAAPGKVTALEKSIVAGDETGGDSEKLEGLIETDAPIVAGDSGGPLYDSDGDIVGIDTAASSTNGSGAASQAYAIPIDDALAIVAQIDSGTETSSVHIGLPAFIGVGVAEGATSGAGITSVLQDGPADKAGITEGSTITAVGGKSVTSPTQLKTRLGAYEPGQKVSIAWIDPNGQRRTATVTLTTGPAD